MSDSNSKRDIIIQAGLQAIPYIGGSLSTLYFGSKQEKRFERLVAFYKELKDEIESIKSPINLDAQNNDDLEAIIENINEKVETETRDEKIQLLKNFFVSTLLNPISNDFDDRKYFLEILDSMSVMECGILSFLYQNNQQVQIRSINKPGVDPYAIYSAINSLQSYGFLESRRGSYQMNGQQDEHLDDIVFVSNFGRVFCQYIKIA